MSGLLGTIVSMSIGGSILIALILLTEKMAGRAMGRQWRYYIWPIVVARLLIPFGPTVSFDAGRAVDEEMSVGQSGIETSGIYGVLPALDDIDFPDISSQGATAKDTAGTDPDPAQTHEDRGSPWQNALRIAAVVWACGCLSLLTMHITAYRSFQKSVRGGMIPMCDPRKLDLVADAPHSAACGAR